MNPQGVCEHITCLRVPIREKLAENHGCIHGALMRGVVEGTGLPDQVQTYYCTVCGYPHLVASTRLFKHNPAAVRFLDASQDLIQYDLNDIITTTEDTHITNITAYYCNACRFSFVTAPILKFKNNKKALQFFAQVAKDIKSRIEALPSKAPPLNTYVDQDMPTVRK